MASSSITADPKAPPARARRSSSTLGLLACSFLLAALPACRSEATLTTTTTVDDRFLARVALFELLDAIEVGDVDRTLERFTDDFLHEGEGRESVAVWLRGLRTGAPAGTKLRARADEVEIRVDAPDGGSTSATLRFHLTIADCLPLAAEADAAADGGPREACTVREDRTMRPFATGAWASHLRRVDGEWRFSGDGRPIAASLLTDNEGGTLTLVASVRDPQGTASAMSLRGEALAETPLARDASGAWGPAAPVVLARGIAAFPSPPLRYTLLVERGGASTAYAYDVEGIVRDYATPLAPSGEVAAPVRFTWSATGPLAPRFQVRVYDGESLLWLSREVFTTGLDYQGPTLADGRRYRYEIAWLDPQGNRSRNGETFVAVAGGTVTPSVAAVAPSTGPAAGGQAVTITGGNLRTGTQVLFGTAEATGVVVTSATQLRCVTPAGAPGPVNVTVVDPSGRTAVARSAYVYVAP